MLRMRWDGRARVAAACLGVAVALGAGVAATRHPHPLVGRMPLALHAAGGQDMATGGAAGRNGMAAGGAVPRAAVAAVPAYAGPQAATPSAPAAAPAGSGGLGAVVVRRVEQTAQVTIRVRDVGRAFDAATAVAGTLGGYVQSSDLSTAGGGAGASGHLVLAVPQAQFGTCLQQLGALGTVSDTTIGGQDVTQQYVDLQGRIDALTAERQSYLTLLGKATAIGEILQIQNALTDVQGQIEDLTGQLRVLDDLSAMARVTVGLEAVSSQAATPPPVPSPLRRIAAALRASARAMADGATALGEAVAWALPWGALGAAGWLVYRRVAARGRGTA